MEPVNICIKTTRSLTNHMKCLDVAENEQIFLFTDCRYWWFLVCFRIKRKLFWKEKGNCSHVHHVFHRRWGRVIIIFRIWNKMHTFQNMLWALSIVHQNEKKGEREGAAGKLMLNRVHFIRYRKKFFQVLFQ